VPIIEEYNAIAKRLRELRTAAPKTADEIADLEHWRDLARETARAYVENRRRRITGRQFLPQPTD
jgi:hypothetical protein